MHRLMRDESTGELATTHRHEFGVPATQITSHARNRSRSPLSLGDSVFTPLPEDRLMAKRAKKTPVFLIFDDTAQRESLATELRSAGCVVHDYMTAREFLIDKPNHSGGVVVADYRLQGMISRSK